MFRYVSDIISQMIRLSFQPSCPICELPATRTGLCSYCVVAQPILGPCCARCGEPLTQELSLCGRCESSTHLQLSAVGCSLWLTDEARHVLHLAKFQGHLEWLSLFKETVERSYFQFFDLKVALVPVPLHRKKFLVRGFNQSELLCHWLRKGRPEIAISNGLQKRLETAPQSTLNRKERHKNLNASFEWRKGEKIPQQVVLVDDVYTTGETLKACARVLKKAGVQTIYAWTLFRTPLRRQ